MPENQTSGALNRRVAGSSPTRGAKLPSRVLTRSSLFLFHSFSGSSGPRFQNRQQSATRYNSRLQRTYKRQHQNTGAVAAESRSCRPGMSKSKRASRRCTWTARWPDHPGVFRQAIGGMALRAGAAAARAGRASCSCSSPPLFGKFAAAPIYREALRTADRIASKAPDSPEAWGQHGVVRLKRGRVQPSPDKVYRVFLSH